MSVFKDKVALISGASRGLGLALAREMVRGGASVVITARGAGRLEQARAELEAMGGQVRAIAGDVGNWEDAEKMVRLATDSFGRLDIVVNNAGISMRGQFKDLAPEVCGQVVQTNLLGCIFLTRAAVHPLLAAKGQVIFISSIAGVFGVPGASIYSATKKALTGLTESLRLELLPEGVNVGVVYLGFTENDPEKRILAADGSPEVSGRPAHHTQAQAAGLIMKMLKRRKKELVMTPVGRLGWAAYRLSPVLVEKAVLFAQSQKTGLFKRFS